ncbi:unnamed protein product [Urochloa decumbens]|uniref:Cytochrome P450 n=1 Tax=Urochloa decumbens TaxID=240449 RepID=A0ABC9B5G2_9POAL
MAMELVPSYLCLIFLCLLLPLLFLYKNKKQRTSHGASANKKLPPGPSRLPIIGSLHHFIGTGTLAHRAISDLARRHAAPLMYLELGEVRVVVASTPDAAREIMKTNDIAFASRPWIPSVRPIMSTGAVGLVFARYGVLWRQLRKVSVMELLSARRVQSFRGIREDETSRLVAAVAVAASSPHGEPVNIGRLAATATIDSTVRSMIGSRFERREEFLQTIKEATMLISGFTLHDLFPSSRLASFFSGAAGKMLGVHRRAFELMDCAISQHREHQTVSAGGAAKDGEDILEVLLKISKEGGLDVPLTIENIKCLLLDLFSGGSETSAATLQWAMSELMRNPSVMQKAQAHVRGKLQGKPTVTEDDLPDLPYLKLVVKETLRLHPVLPLLIPRECMEECEIMGYHVPKGTMVLVNVWAIGRDPKYWEEPDVFKPERFEDGKIDFKGTDFEFIPFGAGRRMCPGITFAQANIEIALAVLLYHFDWELPGGVRPCDLDMTEEMGMTVRRKKDLYLGPTVRVPPHSASE